MRFAAGMLVMLCPTAALAHGGNPAEAKLTSPRALGTVADDQFELTWIDLDKPIPTGTATVNLYYTDQRPPTFFLGAIPAALTGTAIAEDIPEYEVRNRQVWDTSGVPSGTYFLWSRVDDPPEPIPSPIYISFAPAPVHVQHPGDPIGPSVRITRPNTEISYSNEGYSIEFEAFAPNGPASIRLEAGTSLDGSDFTVIADGLTETSTSFWWDTRDVAPGDWTLRAVITDQTGSFTNYGTYFLLITHFFPGRDAGEHDTGSAIDATVLDAGSEPPKEEEESCSCLAAHGTPSPWISLLLLFWRRRGS